MPLKDTATGYGWCSIALHWITAIWILALLFFGNTIDSLIGEERTAALVKHTSLAIAGYAFLLLRIVWRFYHGHPAPAQRQQAGVAYAFGKWVHLSMLVALSFMLISGPLMVWSSGNDIVVFDWFVIPGPLSTSFAMSDFFHRIHSWSALYIFICILLHLGGVYKHLAFNQDGTLTKIFVAAKPSSADKASGPESPNPRH
jgi:cytochrome b561